VFRHGITIEYREGAADAVVLRGAKGVGVLRAEAETLEQRLAAERAVDSVLADSFPASDPPSWTLGITHPQPEQTTNAEAVAPDAGQAVAAKADLIDIARPAANGRAFLKGVVSLAGASGIALLVPFVILLIGMPIALAVGGVVKAAGWLIGLIFG
jgi:hypothetical protein